MESYARITQKELAERLQLNQATVSRALSKSPLLSDKTIQKVLAEAKRIGYRPDPALAGLNAYLHAKRPISKGSVIAWLGKYPTERMSDQSIWDARILRAAKQRGEELGYKVEYFWLHNPECPIQRLQKMLFARGVLGVVFDTQLRPYAHLKLSMELFCAVSIGRTLHSPRLDQVSPDQFGAVVKCYRRLFGCGCRRIGLAISRSFGERSLGNWYAGYLLEQNRKAARPYIPILDCAEADEKSLAKWIKAWQPDGLITAREKPAPHEPLRLNLLKKLGKVIPEDISVALVNLGETDSTDAFGGIEEAESTTGIAAIDLLVSRMRHNLRGIPELRMVSLLEGKWRDGKSIAPRVQGKCPQKFPRRR